MKNSYHRKHNARNPGPILVMIVILVALATVISALSSTLFASSHIPNLPTTTSTPVIALSPFKTLLPLTPTSTPPSPPLAFGNPVFEINFSKRGDGICNDYDPNKLGYDINRGLYYIVPPQNGWASVCHENDQLLAQGILQTTAFPDNDVNYFGYAIFFGWKGNSITTSDACGFGVRKDASKDEAIFIQITGGHWKHYTYDLNFTLDSNPHAIRMILYPSGDATGFLDGDQVAEHKFLADCSSGPVGLIAYGPGQLKIYFTNLKLFELP